MSLATQLVMIGNIAGDNGGGGPPPPTNPTNIIINNSSILDNAAANTVVGTLTMVGGLLPTTFNLVSPSTFSISGANLVRSNTGTITPGTTNVVVNCTDANGAHVSSDVTLPISVIDHLGGQITSITLSNTSGASETPMWSKFFGHPFADSDVTGCQLSGGNPTYPVFKVSGVIVPYSMSTTPTYWPSGRLKHALFFLLLGGNYTIANNGTLSVTVNQSGTTSLPTASSRATSDFTAADLKTIATQLDGPNAGTSYTASLNTAITDALSDNYVVADGPAGKMWRLRGNYKNAGTPEGMQTTYFYVASMQNAGAAFGGIRVQPCTATPWGDATSSLRKTRTFSAMTWQTGSTVIRDNVTAGRSNSGTFTWAGSGDAISVNTSSASYESWTPVRFTTTGTLPTGLALNTTYYVYTGAYYTPPYTKFSVYSTLLDVNSYVVMSSAGSGTHTYTIYPSLTCYGRIFHCGTTGDWDYVQGGGAVAGISTYVDTAVQVKWDMTYARSTLCIPAYDYNAPVTAGSATPFYINTTCGLTNTPDAGGIDEHIGILPTPMVRHIYTNSLTDERNVRAIGLAGGQVNSCVRQISTGFRIPCWNNGHNGSGTPYTGMGTLLINGRFTGAGNSNIFQQNSAADYYNLTGQVAGESSHRVAYNWYPYLLFGTPEYLDMMIETANCAPGYGYIGGGLTNTRIDATQYAPSGTAAGDGSNQGSRNITTSGVSRYCIFQLTDSQRQDAWGLRDTGICAGLIPQSFPECPAYSTYFNDIINDNAAFVQAVIALSPNSYTTTNGLFAPSNSLYIGDVWQAAYWIEAAAMVYGYTQNSAWLASINTMNTWMAHCINTFGLNVISKEEWLLRTNYSHSGCGPLISSDSQFAVVINDAHVTWSNGSTSFAFSNSGIPYVPTVGDQLYFTSPDPPSESSTPIPAAVTAFTGYFIKTVSGVSPNYTLTLSATLGGSAITNSDAGAGGILCWINNKTPLNSLDFNGVSDYPSVTYRSMLLSKSRGATIDATAQTAMAGACPATSSYGSVPTYCFNATA